MHLHLLVPCLFLLWIPGFNTQAGGIINVKFIKYENHQNILNTHQRCDVAVTHCDPFFNIEVKANSKNVLHYETGRYNNMDEINFNDKFEVPTVNPTEQTNPLKISVAVLPRILNIDVVIRDFTTDLTHPLIATFNEALNKLPRPFMFEEEISDVDTDRYKMIDLPGSPSAVKLYVDVWSQCNKFYYGRNCSVKCEYKVGESQCNNDGFLVCTDSKLKPPCSATVKSSTLGSTTQVSSRSTGSSFMSSTSSTVTATAVTLNLTNSSTRATPSLTSSSTRVTANRGPSDITTAASIASYHTTGITNRGSSTAATSEPTRESTSISSSISITRASTNINLTQTTLNPKASTTNTQTIPSSSLSSSNHVSSTTHLQRTNTTPISLVSLMSTPFLVLMAIIIAFAGIIVGIIIFAIKRNCSRKKQHRIIRRNPDCRSDLTTSTSIPYDSSVRLQPDGRTETDACEYEVTDGRAQSFFNSQTYQPLNFLDSQDQDEYEMPKVEGMSTRPLPARPGESIPPPSNNTPSYSHLSRSYTKQKK